MATVNLLLRSEKNPANINIRFSNGRKMDFFAPTNVFINPLFWDKDRQQIKKVIEVKNRDVLNSKLQKLKIHVIDEFNTDFISGEIIDSKWLNSKVSEFFNRPAGEDKKVNLEQNIYYSAYAENWIKNKAGKWKTAKNKYLDQRAINQYESFLKIFVSFEKSRKEKIKLKDIDNDLINDFITYMEEVENYEQSTVKRHVGRLRFFCNRAESDNLTLNKKFKERVFVTEKEEIMEPYLTEDEIEKIFEHDFTNDDKLEHARDNFIIGLWTGLRVSDFNNKLDISNIKNGFIDIKTTKTGKWTNIPLHPMVKAILDKRFGNLPRKEHDNTFNKRIKTICRQVGINTVIHGKVFDASTKRNKVGYFSKYLLVSSHICRRSFATNLYGLVPNEVIQNVGAWKTEEMMLHYIKKTKREHAEVLRDTWNNKYNI